MDTADPDAELPRLLKRLARYRSRREAAQRLGLPLPFRRRRKAALVAALRRAWTGGYTRLETGELVFVPAPLDVQGERLLFYGFAAPPAVLAFAPRDGVAIDIGANLGEWSVPLAKAVGAAGHVLCCEPNPEIATALAATLRINNLPHATALPVAVSDRDGIGRLIHDPRNSALARLDTGQAPAGIPVPLVRLDALIAEHGLMRLDLVKIDVEGHERQVLEGGIESLRRFRPAIVFESGHEPIGDRAAIADLLDALGYEIVAALHHYGALPCALEDYRAARGAIRASAEAGGEPVNLLALAGSSPGRRAAAPVMAASATRQS